MFWDYADELKRLRYWLEVDRFDRHGTNQKLRDHFHPSLEEHDP